MENMMKLSTEEKTVSDDLAQPSKILAPNVPPLDAAAYRLERSLGGAHGASDINSIPAFIYSNPAKIVRRWLGTSSGAAESATLTDIALAAKRLLVLAGSPLISSGRDELIALADNTEAKDMDVDVDGTENKEPLSLMQPISLTFASVREVDGWLTSLAARLLWKQKRLEDAMKLVQMGIDRIMIHVSESSNRVSSAGNSAASLFPLLARLYRLRSLVAESLNSPILSASLRSDMAIAYNMATLRRDTDSHATLLNCMLRDLLQRKHGMWKRRCKVDGC
jgi:hypothetical protein